MSDGSRLAGISSAGAALLMKKAPSVRQWDHLDAVRGALTAGDSVTETPSRSLGLCQQEAKQQGSFSGVVWEDSARLHQVIDTFKLAATRFHLHTVSHWLLVLEETVTWFSATAAGP